MDNRSNETAEWADDLLNFELKELLDAEYDIDLTGFTEDELAKLLGSLADTGGF